MAEDTEDETREEGAEGEDGEEGAKKGGLKKMILFIGLPVILVILAGVAGALFFLGGGEEEVVAEGEHGEAHGEASADGHGDGHGAAEEAHLAELFQFEEPLIVDMSGPDNRSVLLEVRIALAYSDHDVGEMLHREDVQMLLRDEYVEFFRALRVEDIDGSTGSHRIRMELIRRTNLVLAPKTVDGVLLPSFVMQQ